MGFKSCIRGKRVLQIWVLLMTHTVADKGLATARGTAH